MKLIVLATKNRGKAAELEAMLSGVVERVASLADVPDVVLPPEGATSYQANAIAKAEAVARALDAPAVGDDSGLEVDALDGAPGIVSARFAGKDADDAANNARLLDLLRGVPASRRNARFRCVLALRGTGERDTIVEGECRGRILDAPRGREGFGYDPLFLPDGEARTFAELPHDAKNAISHRGRAVAALRAWLASRSS